MRLAVILPIVCALATSAPAIGQNTPLDRLLGKIPPIFGSGPGQPKVSIPATPVLPGLTTVADRTAPGDAVGFDLGGFRLGMSEAAIEATMKARGLKAEGVTRFVDFESQVRSAINTRDGQGGAGTKRSVLGEASLRDDAGGTYMLRMLVWPDGSHLESVTYLAPQGTAVADWQRMLTAKWGRPREESVRDQWQATWGTRGSDRVSARAELGPRGGSVRISSPDGTAQRPGALVDQAVDAFMAANARKPAL